MTAKRSDGIEEEPFEFDESFNLNAPAKQTPKRAPQGREPRQARAPAPRPKRAARRPAKVQYDPPEEDDYPPEDEEFEEEEYYGPQPFSIAGLPPQTVKLVAGGVVALAVVGVIAALALRSSSRQRQDKRVQQQFFQRGVSLTYEAARHAVGYFASGQKNIPKEFHTSFRQHQDVVDVVIQHKPAGSVTFYPVAFALGRKLDKLTERPKRSPSPIQGTEVYETRGSAVIGGKDYPIRVFRQNIKDEKGKVLGRVAVMLFELR